jgi:hypothetical protein
VERRGADSVRGRSRGNRKMRMLRHSTARGGCIQMLSSVFAARAIEARTASNSLDFLNSRMNMIVNFESEVARRKNIYHDKKPTPHDLPPCNETTCQIGQEIRDGFKQVMAAINDNGLQVRYCRSRFQVFPRLFNKAQAASYCGMGVESFAVNCPVKPIRVRSGDRGLRWDIQDLDKWIVCLKENSTDTENVDWLARLDNGQNKDKRRQGLRQQG